MVAAAETLGLAGVVTAAPRILEMLTSSDAEVRAAAAEALGRLRDESAVPALLLGLKAGNLWQNQGTHDQSKFRMLWKHVEASQLDTSQTMIPGDV